MELTNEEEVARLVESHWGISLAGLSSTRPEVGMVSQFFLYPAVDGYPTGLAVRVHDREDRPEPWIEFELELEAQLLAHGMRVPRAIPSLHSSDTAIATTLNTTTTTTTTNNKKKLVVWDDDKSAVVFIREPGVVLMNGCTFEHQRPIAHFLAKLHCLSRDHQLPFERDHVHHVRQRIDPHWAASQISQQLEEFATSDGARSMRDAQYLRELLHELETARDAWLAAELPSGIIHTDLHNYNVLWTNDDGSSDSHPMQLSCVLDWDEATHGPFVFDLALSLLEWSTASEGYHVAWMRHWMAEYQTLRVLEPIERRMMRCAIMGIWTHQFAFLTEPEHCLDAEALFCFKFQLAMVHFLAVTLTDQQLEELLFDTQPPSMARYEDLWQRHELRGEELLAQYRQTTMP